MSGVRTTSDMHAEGKTVAADSELRQPIWAVVSFERCEITDVTLAKAVEKLAALEGDRVTGLCIVTAEAAARANNSPA